MRFDLIESERLTGHLIDGDHIHHSTHIRREAYFVVTLPNGTFALSYRDY